MNKGLLEEMVVMENKDPLDLRDHVVIREPGVLVGHRAILDQWETMVLTVEMEIRVNQELQVNKVHEVRMETLAQTVHKGIQVTEVPLE